MTHFSQILSHLTLNSLYPANDELLKDSHNLLQFFHNVIINFYSDRSAECIHNVSMHIYIYIYIYWWGYSVKEQQIYIYRKNTAPGGNALSVTSLTCMMHVWTQWGREREIVKERVEYNNMTKGCQERKEKEIKLKK